MSYQLFDKGYTANEVKSMKRGQQAEDHVMAQLRKWRESEHVLNILRTIKASERILDKMVMEKWQDAIKGKI